MSWEAAVSEGEGKNPSALVAEVEYQFQPLYHWIRPWISMCYGAIAGGSDTIEQGFSDHLASS
jgi:hypothetical protein